MPVPVDGSEQFMVVACDLELSKSSDVVEISEQETRWKSLEVFQFLEPGNSKPQSTHRSSQGKFNKQAWEFCTQVANSIQNRSSSEKKKNKKTVLAGEICDLGTAHETWEPSEFELLIYKTLGILQEDGLEARDRIWHLCVLETLQPLMKKKGMTPIRTNVNEGAICRGAFELSLLEGVDLISELKELLENPEAVVDSCIEQAFEIVKVFVKIRKYLTSDKSLVLSKEFIKVHDQFLQATNLPKKGAIAPVLEDCMTYMENGKAPHKELSSVYQIIRYILKFKKTAQDWLEEKRKSNESFNKSYEKNTFQENIEIIVGNGSLPPAIVALMKPFMDMNTVEVYHFAALLDAVKCQRYVEHRECVTKNLSLARIYCSGATDYMNKKVEGLLYDGEFFRKSDVCLKPNLVDHGKSWSGNPMINVAYATIIREKLISN
ncbi:hypothetical protein CROQUDRAFT_86047 [Cronartium quercuum f. sp. fusiforme G11]|uniref:Uncharacterized protein n=1 Tax=Cronartium quercuum f. sp. fusiforme G11 TaxID=708437 RepID=A0A9P6NUH0_9BASI|nr:hypothetical protein CROQUDRAFT_86047 [Cronartium quercuum f. sp. fusiforme G11]